MKMTIAFRILVWLFTTDLRVFISECCIPFESNKVVKQDFSVVQLENLAFRNRFPCLM